MYDEGPTVQISMATSELKAYNNRWQGIFENVAKIFNKSFYNSKLVIIIYPFILSLPFMLIKPLRHSEFTGSNPLNLINTKKKEETKTTFGNYIIPRKAKSIFVKMSSNSLNDIVTNPQDAKKGTMFQRTPVPFIPEKVEVEDSKDSKADIVEIRFQYESNGPRKTETYTKKYAMFKAGTIEQLLKTVINIQDAIKKKCPDNAEMKFEIAEMLLGGDAKSR